MVDFISIQSLKPRQPVLGACSHSCTLHESVKWGDRSRVSWLSVQGRLSFFAVSTNAVIVVFRCETSYSYLVCFMTAERRCMIKRRSEILDDQTGIADLYQAPVLVMPVRIPDQGVKHEISNKHIGGI